MKLTISIPKPCHENWNAMHAREGGRFCDSCQHTVADLTRASDAELVALFTGDTKPKCARFDPAQLDRALGAPPSSGEGLGLRSLPVAAFTSLLAVAAGQEALAQQVQTIRPRGLVGEVAITRPAPSPPAIKGKMVMLPVEPDSAATCGPITGDTQVVRVTAGRAIIEMDGMVDSPDPVPSAVELPAHTIVKPRIQRVDTATLGQMVLVPKPSPVETMEVCGTVVDPVGEPMPFVTVSVVDDSVSTSTDIDGSFKLHVPERADGEPVSILIRSVGYLPKRVQVGDPIGGTNSTPDSTNGAVASLAIDPKDPLGITGFVEDVVTGRMLAGAIVSVQGTDVRVRCDARGHFGLRIPEGSKGHPVVLEILQEGSGRMSLPLSAGAVPCSVPIKFTPEPLPAQATVGAQCHELGTVRLEERAQHYTMGIMVRTVDLAPPSTMQRITAPVKNAWRKLTR